MEGKDISPLRQFHDNRIFSPVSSVVFRQLYPEAPSLHTHHGVQLWVEVRRPAENLGRNLIFLDGSTGMIQNMAGQITEQLAQGLRPVEHMAVGQPIDLTKILLAFRHRDLVTAMVNRSVTTATSACKLGLYEL